MSADAGKLRLYNYAPMVHCYPRSALKDVIMAFEGFPVMQTPISIYRQKWAADQHSNKDGENCNIERRTSTNHEEGGNWRGRHNLTSIHPPNPDGKNSKQPMPSYDGKDRPRSAPTIFDDYFRHQPFLFHRYGSTATLSVMPNIIPSSPKRFVDTLKLVMAWTQGYAFYRAKARIVAK